MKFSIIIPCYKVEEYLPECLDSVLSQSCEDWESIIVDDGSPDQCGEIADDYAASDSRFRVVHQENAGLSTARNAGIAIAKGDYLLFLDSDDLLVPTALQSLQTVIETSQADVIAFGSTLWYSEKDGRMEPNTSFNHAEKKLYPSGLAYIDYFVSTRGWGPSAACFYAYQREWLIQKNIQFTPELLHEDELFVPQMLLASGNVVTIPDELYLYRIRENSIAHKQGFSNAECSEHILYLLEQIYSSNKCLEKPTIRKSIYSFAICTIVDSRKVGRKISLQLFKSAWNYASGTKEKAKLILSFFINSNV